MDSAFIGYEYLTDYFAQCSRDQFVELTFIHHDKKQKIQNMSAQVGNDKQLRAILSHAQKLNEQGYGVYYGVCPRVHATRRHSRGSEVDVNTIVAFWIEIDSTKEGRDPKADAARLAVCDTPPTFCNLSGGGVHAYWMLTEPCVMTDDNRHDIKQTLKGLAKLHRGDPAVAEFARVLRVPGFANTKPGRNSTVVNSLYPAQPRLYTLDDMLKFKLAEPVREHTTVDYSNEDLHSLADAALDALSPARRDDREAWLEVLMCLKEGLGEAGFSLADNWSSGSAKYAGTEDIQRTWDSLKRHDKTIATLFHRATEDYGSGKWRPAKLSLEMPPVKLPDWSIPLTVGERGATCMYLEPTEAAIIDSWTGSGVGPTGVDVGFLACISGLSERKIRLSINRLPVVFLTFDDAIYYIQVDSSTGCAEALKQRKAGRPRNLYRLCDRTILHTEIVKRALLKFIKEAFPKNDSIVAPVQTAFLVELGLSDASVKAAELHKRYGKSLAAQHGFNARMEEVRKRLYLLKLQLTAQMKTPDGKPDYSTLIAPLAPDATLGKRLSMLAAGLHALLVKVGGALQIGREKLAALIGCRLGELAAVCRTAGITCQKHVEVRKSVINLPALLAIDTTKYDAVIGGYPVSVQSTLDKKPMPIKSSKLEKWAIQQIKGMGKLCVVYHCANRYTLDAPFQDKPTTAEIKPKVTPAQPTLFDAITTAMHFWTCWLSIFIFERIYSALCFAWCCLRHLKHAVEKNLTYAESWLNKVVSVATPWQATATTLTDRTTGEIQAASIQLSFDLLLADPSPG